MRKHYSHRPFGFSPSYATIAVGVGWIEPPEWYLGTRENSRFFDDRGQDREFSR